jgi:outer membrane protein OmpA-like peptidoglycan-associated protein/tetratricopeptide (TPR) repeat protein
MEKFHAWYFQLKPYSIKLFMFFIPFRFFAFCKVKALIVTLILIAGLFSTAFGQIKAAKNEMTQYNYSKAIEILHQFIQKADPNTKAEATLLMADCYRLQNDMQDARAWYFRAIRLGNTEPLTYFYYAKALRACGDYEAAKKIFLRYDSLMPDDHRGKIYASFCDSAIAWDEKPYAFEVNNARNLNSVSSEFGPVFYNDGVMFATDRIISADENRKSGWAGNGYLKLMFAKPKQTDDFYGEYTLPQLAPEFFNNGSNDGPATFSKDGNEVFITRTLKSPDKSKDESEDGHSNQLKIFSATKTGDKWSKMKPFFFNSNNYSVGYPALSPDGSSLYFVSDVDGGYGGTDIYVSSRDGSTWNKPANLGPIVNTFGNETFPFIAENGDLYFASDGHPGYGGLDIFVTRKVGNVWLIPQNLGKPINSSYDDFALAMYKNDSIGLFSANRPGGRGEDDIYSFRVVGPLPVLTIQPAIAAVSNPVRQQETKPAPVTEEVKPPVEEPKLEVKPEPQVAPKEEPKPVENIVPVPAPVTAEVKLPVEEPKQEVKPEPQVAPKEEPKPVENIVPVLAPVTAEVKPPVEEPKQEVKPEPQVVPKEELKPAENVVPVSAPVTAEVKPPVEEPKQEVKPEPQVAPKEEPKPAENVVPVPAPVTAEVKPPVEESKLEVKPEPQVAPKEEPKPAENVVPVPATVTAIVTPPLQQEIVTEPKVTPGGNVAPKIMVSGCIKDGTTHEAIPAATVFFLDENKGKIIVHKANATGCFISQLTAGNSYRVKAMQTGYSSDCVPFLSDTLGNYTEAVISNDLLLEKIGAIHSYKVDNIYYDFDRYFIRPDAEPALNKLVQIMIENPVTVELGAHADCRGSAAYNMILTEKRAESAVHYIVQKGINRTRIISKWYGKSRLTNNCNCAEGVHCTESQHQANRRTEFKISLPAITFTEAPVDLDKYREGDTLDLRLLPADFFKNCNHRMLGGPLAELLNSSILLPQEQNPNLLYTVQIGAFSYLKPHFNNLNDVMSCKGSDGILRCFVGKFSSKVEAIWYRDHLRSGEFKDAFVTAMDEKHNPSASEQVVYLSEK